MTRNYISGVIHVRFAGRSFNVPANQIDLAIGASDEQIKRALASYLEIPYSRLADYVVDRHANGNLTPVTAAAKLDGAPAKGKAFMEKYGRPDVYPKLFAEADVVKPVEPDAMVAAFDKWDREIGAKR